MADTATKGAGVRSLLLYLLLGSLVIASLVHAQEREYFMSDPTVQKYAVILGGAAANNDYEDRFRHWALRLYDTLMTDYGYRSEQIILLLGYGDPEELNVSGPCRLETIEEKIRALKNNICPGDQVVFFMVGHGTSDEVEAKFVIVGPDITGEAFALILETFSQQDIVVVNTTSSSYPFSRALSGRGRVIIASTQSSAEKYDTIFPEFFIEALEKHAGDRDKNKRVSMWEAFLFAQKGVEAWYNEQNRLPTEHAVLDDNGDGIFSAKPDPAKDDGRLAEIAYLDQLPSDLGSGTQVGVDIALVRELTVKMRNLERSVFLLRSRKREFSLEEYKRQMESLLVELARTNRKLKALRPALGS